MNRIKLRGIGRYGEAPRRLLQEHFGVSAVISGDDIFISDRQLARAFSADALRLEPRIDLIDGQEWETAHRLYSQVPDDLKQYQISPPSSVKLSQDYGFISTIEKISTYLAILPESEVVRYLAEEAIPAMMRCYGVQHVTGVRLDADYQQACISFSKIMLLNQEYKQDDLQQLLGERKPLSSVLPNSLDILAYVECLTRLSPTMFTLPLRRHGCAWHFQSQAMYRFGSDPVNGVAQQFLSDLSPLANSAHFLGLDGLRGMNARAVYQFLRFVVAGINRLMRYLNDPRNFKVDGESVDFLAKVQAYVAVQLIFADLGAINYSTHAHNRISYAITLMDKLANLRLNLGRVKESESRLMTGLASFSQREQLKQLVSSAASDFGYDDLSRSINRVIDLCYERLHQQLREQADGGDAREASRLERLWLQRNVRHGAFLRHNAFRRLFLAADGVIASTIGTLPFLLVVGLISDPVRFLTFSPSVES